MTERHAYKFVVKEDEKSRFWIALEPTGDGLACVGNGFLGLDLKDVKSLESANKFASALNEHVGAVSHTL